VDAHLPLEGLSWLLSRSNAAVLVRVDESIAGIVTRFDLVRTLTGVA